jgi:hypothetical protein
MLYHPVVSTEINGHRVSQVEVIQTEDAEHAMGEFVKDCPEQAHFRWSDGEF